MNFIKPNDRFMFLAILSFIFVSSTALAITGNINTTLLYSNVVKGSDEDFPSIPVLSDKSGFPIVSAQGALAVDLDSGIPLYEKNADSPLLPASTTKIITALVALDNYPLDMIIKVGKARIDGQKMGLIQKEEIKVEDLLYGLLVYSANDAAEVLALNFPGGREKFIEAMNKKAEELSLNDSRFQNPSGLDGNGHVSTARDLVRVSEVAMRNPEFAKIVGTKNIVVKSTNNKISHKLTNINELLGVVPGVMGVKTGWTENARENLVTYIERDGHKVFIAILGSQDRFGETKELIEWIFSNYEWQSVTLPSN